MIQVTHLFESHLAVASLDRAIAFYRHILGFTLAAEFPERRLAFFWIGDRARSMLGLWEAGHSPQRMNLHVAFHVSLDDLLAAPAHLKSSGIAVLDFDGTPTDEPVVLPWMPAASVYFRDPDGNLLEYIAMLEDQSQPQSGVMSWTAWLARNLNRRTTREPLGTLPA